MSNLTLYTEGGPVQANDGIYLTRDADDELLSLCRNGQFSYVLAARQIGKTSLMIHTAERLEKEDVRTVVINLNSIGTVIKIDQWFFGVLAIAANKLSLETDLDAWWDKHDHLGVVQRFVKFFEEVVLNEIDTPIVVFIDEVDATLGLKFKADFFAAVRHLHNERSNNPDLKRLTFSLMGVSTTSDLINDTKRTPFNIGVRVHLEPFTLQEALPLSQGFDLPENRATQVLLWVLNWSGGHPYLTQRICKRIAEQDHEYWTPELVAREVKLTFFDKISEEDNLRFVSNMLTHQSKDTIAVLQLYRKILYRHYVKGDEHSPSAAHLLLSGVVQKQFGSLRVSNGIYAHVFNHQWLNTQLTEAQLDAISNNRIPTGAWFVAAAVMLAFLGALLTSQFRAKQKAEILTSQLQALNDAITHKEDSTMLLSQQLALTLDSTKSLEDQLLSLKNQLIEQQYGDSSLNIRLLKTNRQLADAFRESDSLSKKLRISTDNTEVLNQQLFAQKVVSDSLRGEIASEFHITKQLQIENLTLMLANTAQRQASLGNTELGALLARQAYEFYRMNDGQFQNAVFQALRETLNAHSLDAGTPGGPYLLGVHNEWVRTVAYSPDAQWIASAGDDGRILLNQAHVSDAAPKVLYTDSKSVRSLAFHPSDEVLAVGYLDGTLQLWHNYDSPKPRPEFIIDGLHLHRDSLSTKPLTETPSAITKSTVVSFNPTGTQLIHAGGSTIHVYDALDKELLTSLSLPGDAEVNALAIDKFDTVLLAGGNNGELYLFRNYEPIPQTFGKEHEGPIHAVTISPDGRHIATGGEDTVIRLWTLEANAQPQIVNELRGHEGPINTLSYNKSGVSLISGSSDGSIQLWDATDTSGNVNPVVLTEHDSWVWSLDANPQGGSLVSSGADRTLRLWTTDPEVLADRICMSVPDRGISPKEWHSFVGSDFSYAQYYKPCPTERLGLKE